MAADTWLWISDQHCPFHDVRTQSAILSLVADIRPANIIFGGDLLDCYSVSRFDKDPSRVESLQHEIDSAIKYMESFRHASPKSQLHYLEGNHEERLAKFLCANPELHGLRALNLQNLLELDRLRVKYYGRKGFLYKGFLFKHGDATTKHSACKEMDDEGTSGMSGHVHRNQSYSKTLRTNSHIWYSVGHTADLSQIDYAAGRVFNWQQGIAEIEFFKVTNRFHVTPIPIVENRFLYRGKLYQPKTTKGVKRVLN